jgi:hypothetical protein
MSASRRPCLYRFARSLGIAVVLLLGAMVAAAGTAGAAPRNARPAATQPPPAPPVQPETASAPTASAGLCQCIADHNERRTSCLGSPAVCQSTCGSTHYSFVPYAVFSCSAAGLQTQ